MTITITAGVILLFQSVATRLCNVNQFVTPTANVCYSVADSPYPATAAGFKRNLEMLDNMTNEYLQSEWADSSTLWNFEERWKDGGMQCRSWLDDDGVPDYGPCDGSDIKTTTNP